MTTLIGISGSHGTGKTVTLEQIKNINDPKIRVDNYKVSRSILSELGMTLEEATSTAELTMDYQSKVLQRKIEYDSILSSAVEFWEISPPSYLVDRSVADIYAYTKLWSEKNNIDKNWFDVFEKKCIESILLYDTIILFPINKFEFVDDGVRAKLDTQAKIAEYIEEFTKAHAKKYHVVDSILIDERANEIIKIIKTCI